jgi:hypothetical protein
MRIKIGLLMLSSALAASNITGRADTYNVIIIAAATPTTRGATFDIGTLTGKPDPRIPSAIDLTSVAGSGQEYGFTGIVLLGTDHTNPYNDLLHTPPTAKHADSEEDPLYLDNSVGIGGLAHVYDNDGYHVEVFDPHDSVDITPLTIGSFRLTPIAIPEPSSLMLLGIGILSLAAIARRRFRRL